MKITLFIPLLLGALAFNSCKKGEDDPLLSLRTRKARVTGEWKVTSSHGESTSEDPGSYYFHDVWNYDGSSYTAVSVSYQQSDSSETTHSEEFTTEYSFKKDNTYTKLMTYSDHVITEKGTWNFVGKSKENGVKNKEAITLIANVNYDTGQTVFYDQLNGVTFLIKELRNDKIVLEQHRSEADIYGNHFDETVGITLEKK